MVQLGRTSWMFEFDYEVAFQGDDVAWKGITVDWDEVVPVDGRAMDPRSKTGLLDARISLEYLSRKECYHCLRRELLEL